MSGWFDTIWADDLPSRAVTVYMYLRSRWMIWSRPDTYKSSPVGEPTGLKAATNMFLEFDLSSRSVALLSYPHAPKTHN